MIGCIWHDSVHYREPERSRVTILYGMNIVFIGKLRDNLVVSAFDKGKQAEYAFDGECW